MIIVPTYNEKHNVSELVKRIRSVTDLPVFFVDDSSPDGTAATIRDLQEKEKDIEILVRPQRQGLGPAYRAAMQKVLTEKSPKFIITMDADLSHPAEAIPDIVRGLETHHVVVGSRYTQGGEIENWHWLRQTISRAGSAYAKALTGVPVLDMTAGFVGYQTDALRLLDLSMLNSDGYEFQIEMKYLLHKKDLKIGEIPITFTERTTGKSKFSLGIVMEAALYPPKVFFSRLFR